MLAMFGDLAPQDVDQYDTFIKSPLVFLASTGNDLNNRVTQEFFVHKPPMYNIVSFLNSDAAPFCFEMMHQMHQEDHK
jgi:hypothetical protein